MLNDRNYDAANRVVARLTKEHISKPYYISDNIAVIPANEPEPAISALRRFASTIISGPTPAEFASSIDQLILNAVGNAMTRTPELEQLPIDELMNKLGKEFGTLIGTIEKSIFHSAWTRGQ